MKLELKKNTFLFIISKNAIFFLTSSAFLKKLTTVTFFYLSNVVRSPCPSVGKDHILQANRLKIVNIFVMVSRTFIANRQTFYWDLRSGWPRVENIKHGLVQKDQGKLNDSVGKLS